MAAHYQEEITLRDLADAAGYSPWHALRVFSEIMGKTPFVYLRSVRLSAAAKKLRDTGASLLDIALESAFGSHEGFHKGVFPASLPCPRKNTAGAGGCVRFLPIAPTSAIKTYRRKEQILWEAPLFFTQVIEKTDRNLIHKRGSSGGLFFVLRRSWWRGLGHAEASRARCLNRSGSGFR